MALTPEKLEYLRGLGYSFPPEKYDEIAALNKKKLEQAEKEKLEKAEQQVSKTNKSSEIPLQGKTKEINLLITLEQFSKLQFNDTYNNIWEVRQMNSLADVETIRDLNNLFNYKNICIVHHGKLFSDSKGDKSEKVNLGAVAFDAIRKIISKMTINEPLEIDDEYIAKVIEKSKQLYKDFPENSIKGYFGLKMLFKNFLEGGCFFSVACLEADDDSFLNDIASFATVNIKIFANSNYSNIQLHRDYPMNSPNPIIKGYGSILNSFLTSSDVWTNPDGWKYYDTAQKKIITTKKDLWIYSKHGSIYQLMSRKKELTKEQIDREYYAQQYFSKKFKEGFVKSYGKSKYESYIKEIEKAYPDFKN
jgi:hypothetical protein